MEEDDWFESTRDSVRKIRENNCLYFLLSSLNWLAGNVGQWARREFNPDNVVSFCDSSYISGCCDRSSAFMVEDYNRQLCIIMLHHAGAGASYISGSCDRKSAFYGFIEKDH